MLTVKIYNLSDFNMNSNNNSTSYMESHLYRLFQLLSGLNKCIQSYWTSAKLTHVMYKKQKL